MDREEAKQRLNKNGEQTPVKPATDAKAAGHDQIEKDDKVEESRPETLESAQELRSEAGDLPDLYGETRVVLLPVEPYLLHAYWEVTSADLERAKDRFGDDYPRAQAILRCYDVTNIMFDGTNARGHFDVDVDFQNENSYVRLQSPDKSYFVELGLKTEDSRFYPITRSSVAETPPASPAPRADEHYMLVVGDYDLLETVPMPEEERPSDVEIVWPLNSATIVHRSLTELYKFRMERRPFFKPEVPVTQGIRVQNEKYEK